MAEHESNVDDKLWWWPEWRDRERPWIFAISLSPAQEYISEARKGRDLRAGSLLLSYLSFKLYEPLLEAGGAVALIIVPDVQPNPFFKAWEQRRYLGIEDLASLASGADSITNRAIGLVEEKHLDLLEKAEKRCREAWKEYSGFCKDLLKPVAGSGNWENTWDVQMEDFSGAFDVYWAASKANLAGLKQIRESMEDVVARLERRKDARLFDQWEGSHLPKCIQCGHREILAPRDNVLWKKLAKSRFEKVFDLEENRELLCASCVAKRLFGFEKKIFDREALASTSEVAAALILEKFKNLYSQEEGRFGLELWTTALEEAGQTVKLNGHNWRELAPFVLPYEMKEEVRQKVEQANADWLYDKEDGLGLPRPSPYLAVIRFDGDHMGKTLCKHPGISKDLTNFSGNIPDIVKGSDYLGTAIYSSGDELLALVPKANTLATVRCIHESFAQEVTERIQDSTITCSAGVTFFHCKDSLQYALKECEETLQLAKDVYGRDSVAISVLTASGTPYRFGAQWLFKIPGGNVFNMLKQTEDLIRLLRTDGPLSRAFLYDLAEELLAWIEDPSILYEDLNAAGSVSPKEMEPRLPWLWKQHFHSENKASSYDPSVLFKFLVRLAGHLPNVNNRAANFAGYLKVVDFLARGDEP